MPLSTAAIDATSTACNTGTSATAIDIDTTLAAADPLSTLLVVRTAASICSASRSSLDWASVDTTAACNTNIDT